jgi:hypothetical protein
MVVRYSWIALAVAALGLAASVARAEIILAGSDVIPPPTQTGVPAPKSPSSCWTSQATPFPPSCGIAVPASLASWEFCVVKEGGATHLQIRGSDGMTAILEGLTFPGGGQTITLAVGGMQVQFRGSSIRGVADRLTRGGPGGATLTLEGHVKMHWGRDDRHAEATCEKAVVNLATGRVEVDLSATSPPPLPSLRPAECQTGTIRPTGASTPKPLPPPSGKTNAVFTFSTGMFR